MPPSLFRSDGGQQQSHWDSAYNDMTVHDKFVSSTLTELSNSNRRYPGDIGFIKFRQNSEVNAEAHGHARELWFLDWRRADSAGNGLARKPSESQHFWGPWKAVTTKSVPDYLPAPVNRNPAHRSACNYVYYYLLDSEYQLVQIPTNRIPSSGNCRERLELMG